MLIHLCCLHLFIIILNKSYESHFILKGEKVNHVNLFILSYPFYNNILTVNVNKIKYSILLAIKMCTSTKILWCIACYSKYEQHNV